MFIATGHAGQIRAAAAEAARKRRSRRSARTRRVGWEVVADRDPSGPVTIAGERPLTCTGTARRTPVALYVHFPFCLSICPYCDFVVYAGRAARGPASQIDTFVRRGDRRDRPARRGPGAALDSVYLGGGTPSLMSAAQVERLLVAVDAAFGIADGRRDHDRGQSRPGRARRPGAVSALRASTG